MLEEPVYAPYGTAPSDDLYAYPQGLDPTADAYLEWLRVTEDISDAYETSEELSELSDSRFDPVLPPPPLTGRNDTQDGLLQPEATTGPDATRRSQFQETIASHLQQHTAVLSVPPCPLFSAASRYELEEELCQWALDHGFMFKRRSSPARDRNASARRRLTFLYVCVRSGKHQDKVNASGRQRPARTSLTGCPFGVRVHLSLHDDRERYTVVGPIARDRSTTHNHPPIQTGELPRMRPIHPEVQRTIDSMALSPASPIDIFSHVTRLFPTQAANLMLDDIRATRRRARRAQLLGRTNAEFLLRYLEDRAHELGLLYKLDQRDDDDTLEGLIWSTKTARALFHRFCSVMAIDVTYNGDRHGHKLLHIAGFTATNLSFTVALAAMPDETEETITRYLGHFLVLMGDVKPACIVMDRAMAIRNAARAHWPAELTMIVLCIWHILQNLRKAFCDATWEQRRAAPWREVPGPAGDRARRANLARARRPPAAHLLVRDTDGRVMDREDWDKASFEFRTTYQAMIVSAASSEALEEGRRAWKEQWTGEVFNDLLLPAIEDGLRYVDEDGQYFVHYHINRHPHFGQRTTSRLEALHAALKSYTGDRAARGRMTIDQLVICTLPRFENQWKDVLAAMDLESGQKPVDNSYALFQNIRTLVSEYAIHYLQRFQVGLATNSVLWKHGHRQRPDGSPIPEPKPCTGQFQASLGLPCAHTIAEAMDTINGGSGSLEMKDFHVQWWLTKSPRMNQLKNDVDEAIANGNGLHDLEIVDRAGLRRLRDPVSSAARRAAEEASGVASSQPSGGRSSQRPLAPRRAAAAPRPRRPQASSGRQLTQAEIAAGGPGDGMERCTACGQHHDVSSHPCRAALQAAAAVAESQRRLRTRDGVERAEGDEYGIDDVTDSEFEDMDPRYRRLKPAMVPCCPFCQRDHKRRFCNRMYEWRRWCDARDLRAAASLATDQVPATPAIGGAVDAPRPSASATSATVGEWRPSTPDRTWPVLQTPSPDGPELEDILRQADLRHEAMRTLRLGSTEPAESSVWALSRRLASAHGSPETVIRETQLEE